MTTSSPGGRLDGLPAETTSFVGRRQEVAEVRSLLSASRAVTLTGVGGVGKTRLALRVGREVRRAFRDGVWLVELAALETPGLLARVVAEALRLHEAGGTPPLRQLAEYLRDRQCLIILDNCEQLAAECAELAEALLRAAPGLRILATSRHVLGFPGECAVPVLPLPAPGGAEDAAEGAGEGAGEGFDEADAVRLFAERARSVVPGFAVTDANREVVAAVIARLDGLPLGIELAAARLRALSPRQLLDRLDGGLRVLDSRAAGVAPRHRTLRNLIEWSHALCSEEERLLWHRASVFAGSLDLQAAESVCCGTVIGREDVLDLVIGLVDKSVLIREDHADGVRYRMLETLRQYGLERLRERGEEPELRERHRGYYRELAARFRAGAFGPDQVAWSARLQREHANLRAALHGCFAVPGGAADGLSMATDLLYHWITGYYPGEGREWLRRGLAAGGVPERVRGRALWAAAWLALIQADVPGAAALLGRCRAVGERLGEVSLCAYADLFTGMIAMWEGRPDEAAACYERARQGHRRAGDATGLALSLVRLTLAWSFLGRAREAVEAAEECLRVCEEHEEGWHRAYAETALGVELWRQGELGRAGELGRRGLDFTRRLGDRPGVGLTVELLAWTAASAGRFRRAARLLGVLDGVWSAVGAPLSGFGHLAGYHEGCERVTREALGEAGFLAERRRGARLPYGEALAYALEEPQGEPQGEERSAACASPLTRRELEIARLVARGLTNKEIAASLVIAQRTAEGHVERILTKLGFVSRAQIAGWVGERGRTGE
ncbi:ATP-binding protein [Actinomadura luzonensis]|uniref:ATP-binding protein n=1 Tax=Actinomadura luzonensis TaxID=2805427 RepID=UPI0038996BA1